MGQTNPDKLKELQRAQAQLDILSRALVSGDLNKIQEYYLYKHNRYI